MSFNRNNVTISHKLTGAAEIPCVLQSREMRIDGDDVFLLPGPNVKHLTMALEDDLKKTLAGIDHIEALMIAEYMAEGNLAMAEETKETYKIYRELLIEKAERYANEWNKALHDEFRELFGGMKITVMDYYDEDGNLTRKGVPDIVRSTEDTTTIKTSLTDSEEDKEEEKVSEAEEMKTDSDEEPLIPLDYYPEPLNHILSGQRVRIARKRKANEMSESGPTASEDE